MAINLTNLTANVNNIQTLSDLPNETDGLTPSALKEKFDKAGADIKAYVNGTLLPELETEFAKIENEMPSNYCTNNDARLSNSRKCNNTYDNYLTARENLRIKYGTSLPSSATNGDIFFLYS